MARWIQARAVDSVVACPLACEVVRTRWSSRSSRNPAVACSGVVEAQYRGKGRGYVDRAMVCHPVIRRQIGYLRPIEHHLICPKVVRQELLLLLLPLPPPSRYGDFDGV